MHHLGVIKVPRLEAVVEHYSDVATDGEAACLKVCEKLIECLREFDGLEATPQRLGWLLLFSRCWFPLQTVLMLSGRMPPQSMEVNRRIEFELLLDLAIIDDDFSPLRYVGKSAVTEDHIQKVNDRLCAYLAYCIMQDIEFFNAMRQSRNLNQIYDEELSKWAEKNPNISVILQELWGSGLLIDGVNEVKKKRRNRQKNSHETVNNLMDLLECDSELSSWADRVRKNRREGKKSFGELINPDFSSRGKVIRSVLDDVSQWDYQRTSSVIHGGSMDAFLFAEDVGVVPFWAFPNEREFDSLAQTFASLVHMNLVRLTVLQRDVIFKDE